MDSINAGHVYSVTSITTGHVYSVTSITTGHVYFVTSITAGHVYSVTSITAGHVYSVTSITAGHVYSVTSITAGHVYSVTSITAGYVYSVTSTTAGHVYSVTISREIKIFKLKPAMYFDTSCFGLDPVSISLKDKFITYFYEGIKLQFQVIRDQAMISLLILKKNNIKRKLLNGNTFKNQNKWIKHNAVIMFYYQIFKSTGNRATIENTIIYSEIRSSKI